MELTGEFTLEAVGQGLFYHAKVGRTRLVYDCGSRRTALVEGPAERYRKDKMEPPRGHLDLLVVSHLHCDHVSGLPTLLAGAAEVQTIVLPYIRPEERMAHAAAAVAEGVEADWYLSFALDPVGYVRGTAGGANAQIVLITGGHEGPVAGAEETPEEPPPDDAEVQPYKPKTEDAAKRVIEEAGEADCLKGNSVSAVTGGSPYSAGPYEFVFHNSPAPKEAVNDLAKCLVQEGENIQDVLKAALKDRDGLKRLRRAYLVLAKKARMQNLNPTSLVLYYGPRPWRRDCWHECRYATRKSRLWFADCVTSRHRHYFECYTHCHQHCEDCRSCGGQGHLLLGELNLNNSHVSEALACALGESRRMRVRIGLLPHHGSSDNWNPAFRKVIPGCVNWLVSADPFGGGYGHPHADVVADVERSGGHILLADATSGVEGRCRMYRC